MMVTSVSTNAQFVTFIKLQMQGLSSVVSKLNQHVLPYSAIMTELSCLHENV